MNFSFGAVEENFEFYLFPGKSFTVTLKTRTAYFDLFNRKKEKKEKTTNWKSSVLCVFTNAMNSKKPTSIRAFGQRTIASTFRNLPPRNPLWVTLFRSSTTEILINFWRSNFFLNQLWRNREKSSFTRVRYHAFFAFKLPLLQAAKIPTSYTNGPGIFFFSFFPLIFYITLFPFIKIKW